MSHERGKALSLTKCTFAIFILLIVEILAYSAALYSQNFPLLPENPSKRVAETAISIWEDGRLSQQRYYDSFAEHLSRSIGAPRNVLQDEFALGVNGEPLPKHCYLMSLLAAPFYALFGIFGFWLFNEVCIVAILVACYTIARRHVSQTSAMLFAAVLFSATQLLYHSYGFHYDVLGLALFLGSLALSTTRPLWGGFLLALTILTRITYLFLWPLFLIELARAKHSRKDGVLGLTLGMILVLVLNQWMWGSPFLTAYHRLPQFAHGMMVLDSSSHAQGFALAVFLAEWGRKLFDPYCGLLNYNPLLFLVPLACLVALRSTQLVYFATAGALYGVVMFSYSGWQYSEFGNRFLFPSIFLLSFSVLPMIEWGLKKLRCA